MQILELALPEYTIEHEPDAVAIGAKIDALLCEHFPVREVILRGLSLRDHPGLELDAFIATIAKLGTDRYDGGRTGIGYHVGNGRTIDFFGLPAILTGRKPIAERLIHDFYHSALEDRGYRVRLELIMVYDRSKLLMVEHLYDGKRESDGFAFRDPARKPETLLAIVKLLS